MVCVAKSGLMELKLKSAGVLGIHLDTPSLSGQSLQRFTWGRYTLESYKYLTFFTW